MALQTSGAISLAQVQAEFGGSHPISMSEYYQGGAYVPTTVSFGKDSSINSNIPASGVIRMSNFYGGRDS
jgi:excinuclease UvrABC helicase subunit UvrB